MHSLSKDLAFITSQLLQQALLSERVPQLPQNRLPAEVPSSHAPLQAESAFLLSAVIPSAPGEMKAPWRPAAVILTGLAVHYSLVKRCELRPKKSKSPAY